jgi:hypothetical protein
MIQPKKTRRSSLNSKYSFISIVFVLVLFYSTRERIHDNKHTQHKETQQRVKKSRIKNPEQ